MSVTAPEERPFGEYVRETYGKNIGRGTRVRTPEGEGVVTGADHHIHIRLDGQKHSDPWHPNDVEVLP